MRKQSKKAAIKAALTIQQSRQREAFQLIRVAPKTEGQRNMLDGFNEGYNVIAAGSAGTGKTYIALYLALKKLIAQETQKIVIVRSAVPTRDQGFLPGTLEEKEAVYKRPYIQMVNELCQNGSAWEILTKKKQIEWLGTSFIRGLTIDNAIIIVDEFQNTNVSELRSVLTRVGENTRVVVCGDTKQNDLKKKDGESSFGWLLNVADAMEDWFEVVHFTPEDIVRSGFVKALLLADEELSMERKE